MTPPLAGAESASRAEPLLKVDPLTDTTVADTGLYPVYVEAPGPIQPHHAHDLPGVGDLMGKLAGLHDLVVYNIDKPAA